MHPGHRSLLLGVFCLLLLSGCWGFSSTSSSVGSDGSTGGGGTGGTGGTIPTGGGGGLNGKDDSVVATPSIAGTVSVVIGATQTVAVTFTSSDGLAISGFAISGLALPTGWSGPSTFACANVSTGSGCVLNLTFAPLAAGSGTITFNCVFVDNAGVPRTPGPCLTIPYVATTHDNVIATASPTGQINAVVGANAQAVSVNFTTDDGNPATNVTLTTSLAALPPGWSSTDTGFSCAVVSTGNGCQLPLSYAPTLPGSGTLTLNYSYDDDSGTAKTGQLNIAYAATTNDTVSGLVAPSGQINAVINGSQPVTVTFTTSDGQTATAFQLTSSLASLPAGWSSTDSTFTCSSLSSGNGCQLPLTYAPTSMGGGTLPLTYAYVNNAGVSLTGSVNIAYQATTHDNIVNTPNPSSLAVSVGSSTPVTVTFTTDDGYVASGLTVTNLGALPSGWSSSSGSFTCSTVSTGTGCQLPLSYAPTLPGSGTLTLNYSYNDDSGTAKTGTVNIPYAATYSHLYIAAITSFSPRTGVLNYCVLNTDGSLSNCATTAGNLVAPTGIVFNGPNTAYVADYGNNTVNLCNVAADGSFSSCAATGNGFNFQQPFELAISGNTLYVTDDVTGSWGGVVTCNINGDGTLSGCILQAGASNGTSGVAVGSGYAYTSKAAATSTVDVCTVNGASLSGCVSTGTATTFGYVYSISLSGGYAYLPNFGGSTVNACAINPVDGTFSSCTAYDVSDVSMNIYSAPMDIVFNGSQAYVDDDLSGNVYLCTVGAAGALTNCAIPAADSGLNFSSGAQMAIH
jgi:hypothetical protein